jgi:predicted kinase
MASQSGLPVVIISGAPATGKSTVGRVLAGRLHAALIDQDVATGPMVDVIQGLLGIDDLDDERMAGLTRAARYEVLTGLAIDNLAAGIPVVLIAPYTSERSSEKAWADLATRLAAAGGVPLLVWLSLEPHLILRRMQARGAARDQSKLASGSTYRAALAWAASTPSAPHLALRADQPPDVLVRRILEAVRAISS